MPPAIIPCALLGEIESFEQVAEDVSRGCFYFVCVYTLSRLV